MQMAHLDKFFRLFSIEEKNSELISRQHHACIRQIPLMYLIVSVNVMLISYAHYSLAPGWLTIGFGSAICCFSVSRALYWMGKREKSFDTESQLSNLKSIQRLSVVFSSIVAIWALSFFWYGTPYTQVFLACVTSVTAVAVVLCMVYFPPAALSTLIIFVVGIVGVYGMQSEPLLVLLAASMGFVSLAIFQVIQSCNDELKNLVASGEALESKHLETIVLNKENEIIARTDILTGLLDRKGFFEALGNYSSAFDEDGMIFISLIDLDGFKAANDVFGHANGDAILCEAGERIASHVGEAGFVGRFGGDEFGIIFPPGTKGSDLQMLGDALSDDLARPYQLGDTRLKITGSVGLAGCKVTRIEIDTLFDQAHYALYFAKKKKTGRAVVFTIDHERLILKDAEIELALRQETIEDELHIVFQPIVDVQTKQVICVEALARWNSPALGAISPAKFLPLAEKMGIVGSLSTTLFRKMLKEAVNLPENIQISFNLSAHDLAAADVRLVLLSELNKSTIDPKRIVFELTETALMSDIATARESVAQFHALGCSIALDDFGTGFSSLTYICDLDLDKLKLDGSFVRTITSNLKSRQIAQTVIEMCANMGMECIIEGVETREELDIITSIGGRLIQGFYFAKPARLEELDLQQKSIFEHAA